MCMDVYTRLAFEELNLYKYVTVHDMELRIEPAVVKRVGLSEYVFYYVSNVFRQIFLKTTLDKKYLRFTRNRC